MNKYYRKPQLKPMGERPDAWMDPFKGLGTCVAIFLVGLVFLNIIMGLFR